MNNDVINSTSLITKKIQLMRKSREMRHCITYQYIKIYTYIIRCIFNEVRKDSLKVQLRAFFKGFIEVKRTFLKKSMFVSHKSKFVLVRYDTIFQLEDSFLISQQLF